MHFHLVAKQLVSSDRGQSAHQLFSYFQYLERKLNFLQFRQLIIDKQVNFLPWKVGTHLKLFYQLDQLQSDQAKQLLVNLEFYDCKECPTLRQLYGTYKKILLRAKPESICIRHQAMSLIAGTNDHVHLIA